MFTKYYNIDWLVTLLRAQHLDSQGKVQVALFYLAKNNSQEAKERVLKFLKSLNLKDIDKTINEVNLTVSTDMDTDPYNFKKYDDYTLRELSKFLKTFPKDAERLEFSGRLSGYLLYESTIKAEKPSILDKFLFYVSPKWEIIKIENGFDADNIASCEVTLGSQRNPFKTVTYTLYGHHTDRSIKEQYKDIFE